MGIVIHYNPASQHGRRTRIAAIELGLDAEFTVVPFPSPAEYLALNPMGKVPTLVDGDFVLWESNAIMAYLAEQKPSAGLYGTDARSRAEVNRWLFWESAHFGNACITLTWERLMKPMFQKQPPDDTMVAAGDRNFQRFAKVLDAHLANREYVTGKLSIADFAISTIAMYRNPAKLDTAAFPRLEAYLARMEARESWKQTQPQF